MREFKKHIGSKTTREPSLARNEKYRGDPPKQDPAITKKKVGVDGLQGGGSPKNCKSVDSWPG